MENVKTAFTLWCDKKFIGKKFFDNRTDGYYTYSSPTLVFKTEDEALKFLKSKKNSKRINNASICKITVVVPEGYEESLYDGEGGVIYDIDFEAERFLIRGKDDNQEGYAYIQNNISYS